MLIKPRLEAFVTHHLRMLTVWQKIFKLGLSGANITLPLSKKFYIADVKMILLNINLQILMLKKINLRLYTDIVVFEAIKDLDNIKS